MQSLLPVVLLLDGLVPFASAVHHHYSHHRPSGYHSGLPFSKSGPFSSGTAPAASAQSSVPYPAGNGTVGGATGTSGGSISTTITSLIQSTIYVSSSENSVGASGGAAPSASYISGLGSSIGSGESSACDVPATVTVTQGVTVTVTNADFPSNTAAISQTVQPSEAPTAAQSETQSQSGYALQSSSSIVVSSSATSAATSGATSFPENTLSSLPAVSSQTDDSTAQAPTSEVSKSAIASTSASVATSSPSATPSKAPTSGSSLTPNGIKAGVAGYRSITDKSSWSQFTPHIGWYSDYWPNTPDSGSVSGIGMLWGDGHLGGDDASRLAAFKALTTPPKYMLGVYEPDFTPPDSSSISSSSAASTWSTTLAPLGAPKGSTLLGSPSLATQKDETWLTPFETAPQHPTWDYTCIHTNKPNVTGVMEDVEYYLGKYGKPIWVSEFACVDDQNGWTPCTDPGEIKAFIEDVVKFLQGNESVVAYGYSNGDGLGTAWPMIDSATGAITTSGQVYLDVISAL